MNTEKILVLIAIVAIIIALLSFSTKGAEMVDRKETSVIIIHHSAGASGNAEIFRKHHVGVNNWSDIGYHFVVCNGNGGVDGKIEVGRPLRKQGAHAGSVRNKNSVGVCLVGEDKFTENQIAETVVLVAKLCYKYDIEPSAKTIQPHHDKCPGPGLDVNRIIWESKELLDFYKELVRINKALLSAGLFYFSGQVGFSSNQLCIWPAL